MKQLQVDTIKKCKRCKNKFPLTDLHGWTTNYYGLGHTGLPDDNIVRTRPKTRKAPIVNAFICKPCWRGSFEADACSLYNSINSRQKMNFKSELTFTLPEFMIWLKKQGYIRICNAYRKAVKEDPNGYRGDMRPSIDRINSFLDYRLDNMQILPLGENVAKSNLPAFAAKELTMRFFKKLRKRENKTKYEMAKHLGMLPQTYFYLEDKARGCSFEILILIKNKLGLSWEEMGSMLEVEVSHNAKDKKKDITASSS